MGFNSGFKGLKNFSGALFAKRKRERERERESP